MKRKKKKKSEPKKMKHVPHADLGFNVKETIEKVHLAISECLMDICEVAENFASDLEGANTIGCRGHVDNLFMAARGLEVQFQFLEALRELNDE